MTKNEVPNIHDLAKRVEALEAQSTHLGPIGQEGAGKFAKPDKPKKSATKKATKGE